MTSPAPGTKPRDDPRDTEGSTGAPSFRRVALEAAAVSSAVALGWVLMAVSHPTTTYHFAPLVAVVVGAVLVRARTQKSIPLRRALVLTSGSALPALISTAVIESLNALGGPTLIGAGNALVETLVAIAAGLIIGVTTMITPWRPRDRG
ncbi:putative membrane protein YedE/YeeE [Arthrobacter sp. UYCu512]